MVNRIIGVVGLVWGGYILGRFFVQESPQLRGGFSTTQVTSLVMGGLLFFVGLGFLFLGGGGDKS